MLSTDGTSDRQMLSTDSIMDRQMLSKELSLWTSHKRWDVLHPAIDT